ncbi:gamma-glutamyl-gamma-aminobutyrate hydrolase family protein [Limnohabitans sp.]|jgi:putative glutamine amidotransferase|uniref:gamma-glutamyl-gamma-aminobutyrate hydrolase family protein n=1 Tax=Limnohabitans sp. TaxID=1907725 RepID=UPI0037BE6A9A
MRPWIWVTHDHRQLGKTPNASGFTVLGDKYAIAVKQHAEAEPFTLPTASAEQIPELLAQCDGVLLTGSPSNIHPSHFDQTVVQPELPLDPLRDQLSLPLIRACLEQQVPILGICRGLQEINVALGGSLHQQVHDLPHMLDHREPANLPYEDQYALSHPIRIVPGSPLAHWAEGESAMVNSLHGQGIDRLADALEAMAFAPDGLVEAVRVRGATHFAYAVQWHPEWRSQEQLLYLNIFKAFGQACTARRLQRLKPISKLSWPTAA